MNSNLNHLLNIDSPFGKKLKGLYQKGSGCVEIYKSENDYFVIIYDNNGKITDEKQFGLDDYNGANEEFEYQISIIENRDYYIQEVDNIVSKLF